MQRVALQQQTAVEIPPRWWTVKDVAEYRQISVRTVYAMVARAKRLREQGEEGGIPFSQPHGTKHLRFKPAAIRAFFEGEEAA